MTDLDVAAETIGILMDEIVGRLPPDGAYPKDDQGPLTNLAHLFRMRAIASYLASGDTASYVADLHRSGQVRLYYLRGSRGGFEASPRFLRTSRNRAFFDCVAVNDLDDALELARLCDDRFAEALEYEDDHLFVQYLQSLLLHVRKERPMEALDSILRRFQAAAPPEGSPFLDLAAALGRGDANGAAEALGRVLRRREANYARSASLGDLPSVVLQTERFVDIQGVAIVRLAELSGLQIATDTLPRVPRPLIDVSRGRHAFPPIAAWRLGSGA